MKERPILFSGPMVRAILNGSKTQTRRVVKPQPPSDAEEVSHHPIRDFVAWRSDGASLVSIDGARFVCPYGAPGWRLWVRETFQRFSDDGEILYKADPASLEAMNEFKRDECQEARWRPSIHMPRSASRITLEITDVRVERLQDISEDDAIAEGVSGLIGEPYGIVPRGHRVNRDRYRLLWESINGTGSWDANPWVWVISFKRVEAA